MSTPPTSNEVASEIKQLDWSDPERYRVEWRSAERWDYDAVYTVKEIRFGEGGRPMVKIEGPNGGEYLIDSNPAGRPKVKHLRSDGYVSSDRLAEIRVYKEEVDWHHRLFRSLIVGSETAETTAN